jgi:acetyl/propionyl-CoA carboxylase alpha subunit
VQSDWSLSIGKITSFQFPTGNGIRIDTHLLSGRPSIVSADFDSLIAKIIVTASSWADAVRKARRALHDTYISGVKTNITMLQAITAHPDFLAGTCDTQWLERVQSELLQQHNQILASPAPLNKLDTTGAMSSEAGVLSSSVSAPNTLFRKGDAWSLILAPKDDKNNKSQTQPVPHHLEITRVLRNDFPASLTADVLFTAPGTPAPTSMPYTITLASTTASASAATAQHRHGNPSDSSHVVIPFPGKLVEVLVDEGDVVKEGDVVCVVQQMKMELEVRSHRRGRVSWVLEVEEGEDVGEGTLAAVVDVEKEARL